MEKLWYFWYNLWKYKIIINADTYLESEKPGLDSIPVLYICGILGKMPKLF